VVPYAPTYANGHISATGDPIHSAYIRDIRAIFAYKRGFSGSCY